MPLRRLELLWKCPDKWDLALLRQTCLLDEWEGILPPLCIDDDPWLMWHQSLIVRSIRSIALIRCLTPSVQSGFIILERQSVCLAWYSVVAELFRTRGFGPALILGERCITRSFWRYASVFHTKYEVETEYFPAHNIKMYLHAPSATLPFRKLPCIPSSTRDAGISYHDCK